MKMQKLSAVVLLMLGTTWAAWAQTTQGEIVGTARDASGAAVPGVSVTAANTATGLVRATQTADNGTFRIPALPAGTYKLTAEKSGFAKLIIEQVDVLVAETHTVDISMQVAAHTETVTVQEAAPIINTETQHLGAVISQTQVTALPLNGRNFTQLALLNAGVSAFGGGGGQQGGEGGISGYSSNGQRSSSNNFMVDGVDNNNYNAGSVSQLPSIDSIQEFQVQTNNYAAEYGRNSGSVINLVTKSGTNKFHGSLYEFLRNDIFDARNFFANPNAGAPELRLNQFGGTLGGPILKDRTFFFGNYEGFRQRAGITRLTVVPTNAQKTGVFTDANGNPVQLPLNPVSAKLLQLYPEPNTAQPGGNFISSPALSNDTDQYLIKVDHHIGTHTFTVRYSYTRSDIFAPFAGGQQTTAIPGFGVNNSGTTQLASIGYTKMLTPATFNEFRLGYSRNTGKSINQLGPQAADFGFNTGWAPGSPFNLGNMPNLTMSGGLVSNGGSISNLGSNNNNPSGVFQNTLQFIDYLSHTTSRHELKFGFDIRNIRDNRFYDLDQIGQITFTGGRNPQGIKNPLADLAEGLPNSSLHFVGDSSRSYRITSFDFFGQDSFRLRSNLTLNYGLRYELNTVLHEATNRAATFRPERFATFLSPMADQTNLAVLEASGMITQDQGGLYNPDHNNFAPRVGMAWSLGRKNLTVVRAGYGIFYDTVIGQIPGNVLLNPPFLPDFFDTPPGIGWPNSFAPSGFPVITITPANFLTPYSQAWNVDIQRQFPAQMLFEIAYVGTTGTHLPRFRQINQAFITQAQINALTPDVVTRMVLMGIPMPVAQRLAKNIAAIPNIARVPYFGYAQIFQAEDSISSSYNGLQLKLDKRTSHGLSFGIAYTYSKSIDAASVFFGSGANSTTIFPQDNYDTRAEKGLSDFNIRHRLVGNYVYEIPTVRHLVSAIPRAIADGWVTTGIVTVQTGQPFSVLTGSNQSSTGLGTDRPNLVGDPNAGPGTVDKWFNTAAFTLNAPLTFGNAGRNIAMGPAFRNFDFALLKNTKLAESLSLQFRAEFFNIFNDPHFALPRNTMTAPNFGALFQTPDVAQNNVGLGSGGPRLIQFGLKLTF
jgi:Carboxypeptidase regulatory-like domain/TonB-dependent Receptor Plug Domain